MDVTMVIHDFETTWRTAEEEPEITGIIDEDVDMDVVSDGAEIDSIGPAASTIDIVEKEYGEVDADAPLVTVTVDRIGGIVTVSIDGTGGTITVSVDKMERTVTVSVDGMEGTVTVSVGGTVTVFTFSELCSTVCVTVTAILEVEIGFAAPPSTGTTR